jgi:hypothetical protein
MHDLRMATKTISLELDAYEKLHRARRRPGESFSSVVRRGRWDDLPLTSGEVLADLRALVRDHPAVLLPLRTLDALENRPRPGHRRLKPRR